MKVESIFLMIEISLYFRWKIKVEFLDRSSKTVNSINRRWDRRKEWEKKAQQC